MQRLCCKALPPRCIFQEFLDKIKEFQEEAALCVSSTVDFPPTERINKLYQFGSSLHLHLPEVDKLRYVLSQAIWIDKVNSILHRPSSPLSNAGGRGDGDGGKAISLETLRSLIEESSTLAPHPRVNKILTEMEQVVSVGEKWDERARVCLQARPHHVISTVEAIVNEAEQTMSSSGGASVELPHIALLKEAIVRSNGWINEVETLTCREYSPYLEQLERLVSEGREIPIRLDLLPQVSQYLMLSSYHICL